jgi:hypothetical protein
MAHAQMDFDIVAGPLDLGGSVKGAPYAAEAVSEVVQTLADGNRIVRSSASAFYRDGAGRTRREEGLAVIGPLVGTSDEMKRVIITDPEMGVTYLLNPATRTARRLQLPAFGTARLPAPPPPPAPPGASADVVFFETAVGPAPAGASLMKMFTARRVDGAQDETSESLGRQTIDGVTAEGTRSILTIPAGQIGNECLEQAERSAVRRHDLPAVEHRSRGARPVAVRSPLGLPDYRWRRGGRRALQEGTEELGN